MEYILLKQSETKRGVQDRCKHSRHQHSPGRDIEVCDKEQGPVSIKEIATIFELSAKPPGQACWASMIRGQQNTIFLYQTREWHH